MRLAQSFARWVANSEYFELAAPQVLPILNLRVRATGITSQKVDALQAAIIEEVNRDGQRWISAATVNGQSVIRTMVISYLTEERHIKDLQASLVAACCSLGLESKSSTLPTVLPAMPSGIQLTPAPLQDAPPA
jgi:glutamate/tyrosine decarboxylase-like PLP-dependent enzyme